MPISFPGGGFDKCSVYRVPYFGITGAHAERREKLLLIDGSENRIFESPGTQEYAEYEKAENYQEVRLDGEKYILFVNNIPETGWKSLCFVPEKIWKSTIHPY